MRKREKKVDTISISVWNNGYSVTIRDTEYNDLGKFFAKNLDEAFGFIRSEVEKKQ
jgi:hypothetical protein